MFFSIYEEGCYETCFLLAGSDQKIHLFRGDVSLWYFEFRKFIQNPDKHLRWIIFRKYLITKTR